MSYSDPHPFTLKQWAAMTKEQREEWLGSDAHLWNCIGYNEGCTCCLEKFKEEE